MPSWKAASAGPKVKSANAAAGGILEKGATIILRPHCVTGVDNCPNSLWVIGTFFAQFRIWPSGSEIPQFAHWVNGAAVYPVVNWVNGSRRNGRWRFSVNPEALPATSAFGLSRWRDGRCRIGCRRALLVV